MCEYIRIYKIHIIRFENEQKLGLNRKSFLKLSGKPFKH